MTGGHHDGESIWDGPDWAAPENARRLASQPEYGRHDPVLGCFTRWLVGGDLDQEQFVRALKLKLKIEKREQSC